MPTTITGAPPPICKPLKSQRAQPWRRKDQEWVRPAAPLRYHQLKLAVNSILMAVPPYR